MNTQFKNIDKKITAWMHRYGISILRYALAIVFLWFGLLKILGVSPVVSLISQTYSFMPEPLFVQILGIWEVIVGLGLLCKVSLRVTLLLLWLQMAGTFTTFVLKPEMFFNGNLFFLTADGEFVIKNLVLVSAGLVIGGHELRKEKES